MRILKKRRVVIERNKRSGVRVPRRMDRVSPPPPRRRSKRNVSSQEVVAPENAGSPPKRVRSMPKRGARDDDERPGPSHLATSRRRSSVDKRMKQTVDAEDAEGEKCAICLIHDIENPGRLSSCAHIFCVGCIKQWIGMHGTCPLCKSKSIYVAYQHKDKNGVKSEKKESAIDLMKTHRNQESIRRGDNVMAHEQTALNSAIRAVRNEIDSLNREEDSIFSSRMRQERERLCIALTAYRRLGSEIGHASREDIVNDSMFRKLVYEKLLLVHLVPPTGRDRPVTPELFRTDADLVERANAFLSRDLPMLCDRDSVEKAKTLIMDNLKIFAIDNREIENVLKDKVNVYSSRHLIRSLGDFLRSGLSLEEYNSRAHHTCPGEVAQLYIADPNADDDDIQEMFANINTDNVGYDFPPSISQAIDGPSDWETRPLYRDVDDFNGLTVNDRMRMFRTALTAPLNIARQGRNIVTLQSDDDEDGDEDESDEIYTRNCILPRSLGAPHASTTSSAPMTSDYAMSLFESTGAELMQVIPDRFRPFVNNLLRAKPEMRSVHTQTKEGRRTNTDQREKIVAREDSEQSGNEVIELSDSDDDVHVLDDSVIVEEPQPSTSTGGRKRRVAHQRKDQSKSRSRE